MLQHLYSLIIVEVFSSYDMVRSEYIFRIKFTQYELVLWAKSFIRKKVWYFCLIQKTFC